MIKKPATKDNLVDAMNELATAMLKGAANAGVTNQVEIFSAVTKWVAVKNRLNIADEADGSRINEYRDALADTPAPDAIHRTFKSKHPSRNDFRNVDTRNKAIERSRKTQGHMVYSDRARGGAELDAIKRRLPDANAGDHVDGGDAAGGTGAAALGRRGRIRAGAVGPADADADGSSGESGV